MMAQKYVFQKHNVSEKKLRCEKCIVNKVAVRVPMGSGLSNLRIENCHAFLQFQVLIILKLYFSIAEKYNEDCC